MKVFKIVDTILFILSMNCGEIFCILQDSHVHLAIKIPFKLVPILSLIYYSIRHYTTWLVIIGLACSTVADIFLEMSQDFAFYIGAVGFLLTHVFYIIMFIKTSKVCSL